MDKKILFTWSGGKDSAMSLHEILMNNSYKLLALLTTITEDYNRISMHGVQAVLLEQQAESIGFPVDKIYITKNATNEEYEEKMRDKLMHYKSQGVSSVVFGDIFLEDLKKYREKKLMSLGMKGIFPVWKRDTTELAHTFIGLGFKAVITCIDSKVLDKKFIGREFDESFLNELPSSVDPCGENGEFHSFVYDGPIFKKELLYEKGDIILKSNRFYFCDLMPIKKDVRGNVLTSAKQI